MYEYLFVCQYLHMSTCSCGAGVTSNCEPADTGVGNWTLVLPKITPKSQKTATALNHWTILPAPRCPLQGLCNYKIESNLIAYGWGLLDKECRSYIELCRREEKGRCCLCGYVNTPGFTSIEYLLSIREGAEVSLYLPIFEFWKHENDHMRH